MRVTVAHTELRGRGSSSGRRSHGPALRTIAIPEAIRPDVVEHLAEFVERAPDALRVHRSTRAGDPAGQLQHAGAVDGRRAGRSGCRGLHFHDLRHTGQHAGGADQGRAPAT